MTFLYGLALFAGLIMWIRSMLFWLYFIQLKHYRLDRLRLGLTRTSFYSLIFSKHRIVIMLLLAAWWSAPYISSQLSARIFPDGLFIISAGYLIAHLGQTIRALYRHSLQVPSATVKMRTLYVIIFLLEVSAFFYFFGNLGVILLVEFFQPVIVLSVFGLAYTPNIFLHRYFINRARKKIATHKNLIVIGITGSYGKTTTKEFLAHILSKKYKVLKTPAHINVDTGVAKAILRGLTPEHEVFIVEMGAYKKGEIKKICDLAKPQYAVLTGLSDQHLELFGSMEAIAEAKFELVEAIRDQSHIIVNAGSELLVSECKRRRTMSIWYGIRAHAARFKPTDIVYTEKETSFTLHGVKFQVPCIGTAQLNNLLGAITAAVELGLHLDEIASLVSDLPKIPGTMEPKLGNNGALIIDDTYNANTEGVVTALRDLPHFNRSKKLFVFKEIIELGERTDADHTQIAKTAAHAADYIMLLPSTARTVMSDALVKEEMGAARVLDVGDTKKLRELCDADTVVLCEGRDAVKIMSLLL